MPVGLGKVGAGPVGATNVSVKVGLTPVLVKVGARLLTGDPDGWGLALPDGWGLALPDGRW